MPTHPEEIRLGQLNLRFLIDGPASGSSLTMFEFEVAPGAKVPIAHSHDAYDETIYGLEGTLTLTLLTPAGTPQTTEITPGHSLFIPRGVPHRFDNLHPDPSRSLAVITPGILGAVFFREMADTLSSAMAAGTPPDPAALGQIMRRHGLTPTPQLAAPPIPALPTLAP
jgi:quercetin dioxygenase-like cupin family protein